MKFISNMVVEETLTLKSRVDVPTITTTTLNGNLNLSSSSSYLHFITGTQTGFSVVLPDATSLPVGLGYKIYNRSSQPITVKYNNGTSLIVVSPESLVELTLQTNGTQNGVFVPFAVEVSQAAGIKNYTAESQTAFSTSSTTDVQITDFVVTPDAGRYAIFYDSSNQASSNNSLNTVSLYKNGTQISGTERTARSTASNFVFLLTTQGNEVFNGTDQLRVYVRTSTGTLTVNSRSIIMIRLGGA